MSSHTFSIKYIFYFIIFSEKKNWHNDRCESRFSPSPTLLQHSPALLDGLAIHAKFILLFSLLRIVLHVKQHPLNEIRLQVYLCIISAVIDTFCLKVSPSFCLCVYENRRALWEKRKLFICKLVHLNIEAAFSN